MPKSKDQIGSIIDLLSPAIASLAADDLVSASTGNLTRAARVLKAHVHGYVVAGAASETVLIGLSSAELSDAEIEEYLETSGPLYPDQVPEAEVVSRGRLIEILGQVPRDVVSIAGLVPFNFEAKASFYVREGVGVRLWAYNFGPAALHANSDLAAWLRLIVKWEAKP